VLVLDSHDTTTPLSGEVGVIVELGLELLAELLKIDEVFTTDFGESEAGGGLEMNKLTEVSLATDEAEGDTLLSAESGQVNNELDGVNIVGDDNHLSLVLLDKGGHVVETELEVHGLVTLLRLTSFSFSLQSSGLLGLGLRSVLGEQFKELGSLVLLESLAELVDGGGHLQSLHQDSLLSLNSNVARPFDETGKVTLGLDIASKSEVLNSLLEERTIAGAGGGASLGLNDLLSLSFLHLYGTTISQVSC